MCVLYVSLFGAGVGGGALKPISRPSERSKSMDDLDEKNSVFECVFLFLAFICVCFCWVGVSCYSHIFTHVVVFFSQVHASNLFALEIFWNSFPLEDINLYLFHACSLH